MSDNLLSEYERIKGSLLGFVVGDALGVPVEFKNRLELSNNKVIDMQEHGTYNQPIGSWSDDSSMVIATIDSIIKNEKIDYFDIMNNFLKWYENGEYTPGGTLFDIGNATSVALMNYKNNKSTYLCGSKNVNSNGNGSLMRILPISIYLHFTDEPMFDIIKNISSMTHAHDYSILSCIIYSVFINEYFKDFNVKNAYLNMQKIIKEILEKNISNAFEDVNDLKQKFDRIIYNDIAILEENEINSTGFVIDTLEACFWCLLNTNNFKDAVLKAVNLGHDTDTIGALTGGLAGLVYGVNAIPENWINVLKRKDDLIDLINKYWVLLLNIRNKQIIYEWQMGLGDMRKAFNDENPLPKKKKKADKTSWKCNPFTKYITVECNIVLTKEEFEIISMGHIPEVMEDHWFMYCDEQSINYFRSWTGIQMFKAYYKFENNKYIIYSLEINDNKEEYNEPNVEKSIKLFNNLIYSECKTYND